MNKYEIYNKILQILSELPLNSKKMEVFKKALSDLLDLEKKLEIGGYKNPPIFLFKTLDTRCRKCYTIEN